MQHRRSIFLLCAILVMVQNCHGQKTKAEKVEQMLGKINGMRARYTFGSMSSRRMYYDEELEDKAEKALQNCDAVKDIGLDKGDFIYGIYNHPLADIKVAARFVYGKVRIANTPGLSAEDVRLGEILMNPLVYKIGCSTKLCTPSAATIACYVNRDLPRGDYKYVTLQACSACSKSFTGCTMNLCDFPDNKLPSGPIPEDEEEMDGKMPVKEDDKTPEKKPEGPSDNNQQENNNSQDNSSEQSNNNREESKTNDESQNENKPEGGDESQGGTDVNTQGNEGSEKEADTPVDMADKANAENSGLQCATTYSAVSSLVISVFAFYALL